MAEKGNEGLASMLLQVAALVEERLNYRRDERKINSTQMQILAVLETSWRLQTYRRKITGDRPSDVARLLSRDPTTISHQIANLRSKGLVMLVPNVSEDRREKFYTLTDGGVAQARAARVLLDDISIVLRATVGHQDAAVVAEAISIFAKELPKAPSLDHPGAAKAYRRQMADLRRPSQR